MFKLKLAQWCQFGNEHFFRTRIVELPFVPTVGMRLDGETVTMVEWWSDDDALAVKLEQIEFEHDAAETTEDIKEGLVLEGWTIEGCRIDETVQEPSRD